MKKIINDPKNVVDEMCRGMELAHPDKLSYNSKYRFIRRAKLNPDKVTLISGGGSGHEPFQGGYIGEGLLDAAICGNMFAAPATTHVYNAILETASSKGTLLLIINYTGDRLCFGGAAEMAIEDDDMRVEQVIITDDVVVPEQSARRGVAGAVLVDKIAGAAAEAGMSLEEVKRIAQKAADQVRSIGFALTSCILPEKGSPMFHMAEDEMEFGMGVHGEQGVERIKMLTADEIAKKTLEHLVPDLPFRAGDEVILLVNGLGGTPLQELYVLNGSVRGAMEGYGLKVYKTLVGNYMTSLDMAGASISLMRVDDELKALFDAPADAPAYKQP